MSIDSRGLDFSGPPLLYRITESNLWLTVET